ncbi:hypothetical protein chiPu_0031261, partial [Chiloscyllium punctatum]|nr:hypothetical protein [Chiloscyllium punctatum]
TRRQHGNRVDILACQEFVHVVMGRNSELPGNRIRPRADRIADRNQACSRDVIATQEVGMALGDTPAPEQAESDHATGPVLSRGRPLQPAEKPREQAALRAAR